LRTVAPASLGSGNKQNKPNDVVLVIVVAVGVVDDDDDDRARSANVFVAATVLAG
jgi:hypothetical protein